MKQYFRLAAVLLGMTTLCMSLSATDTYQVGDIFYIDGVARGIVFDVDDTGENGLVVSKEEYVGVFSTNNPGLGWTMTTSREQAFERIQTNGIHLYDVYVWCTGLGDGWLLPTVSDYEKIFDLWNGSSNIAPNDDAQADFYEKMLEIDGIGIEIDYNAEYNPEGLSPIDAYWTCNASSTRHGLQAFRFQDRNSWGADAGQTHKKLKNRVVINNFLCVLLITICLLAQYIYIIILFL